MSCLSVVVFYFVGSSTKFVCLCTGKSRRTLQLRNFAIGHFTQELKGTCQMRLELISKEVGRELGARTISDMAVKGVRIGKGARIESL